MMIPTMTAFRDPVDAPLRKLSVDLIKTYKHINEVRSFFSFVISLRFFSPLIHEHDVIISCLKLTLIFFI